MKFSYMVLPVARMAQSIAFYEQAFGFVVRVVADDGDYAELLTGYGVLSLVQKPLHLPSGTPPKLPPVEVDFDLPLGKMLLNVQNPNWRTQYKERPGPKGSNYPQIN